MDDDSVIEIRDFIRDKHGKSYWITGWQTDSSFHGHVENDSAVIGRINWEIERSTSLMTIGDLIIFEYIGYPPIWKRIFPFLKWNPPTYRGLGLGNSMLDYVIRQAEVLQVDVIGGWITSDDLHVTPYLPEFYKKRGFQVDENMNIYLYMSEK